MGKTLEYQGYRIESVPHHDADGGKWQLRVLISAPTPRGLQTHEFSADVLYSTPQEADIHGIAFGQRVIDGKVDGKCGLDMTTADRRATPRLRVQFRTVFSVARTLEGTGVILDLSLGGCRVESSVPMTSDVSLELLIHVPELEWPIMIEAATVKWVSGPTFGLAFIRIKASEQQRLEQVVNGLLYQTHRNSCAEAC